MHILLKSHEIVLGLLISATKLGDLIFLLSDSRLLKKRSLFGLNDAPIASVIFIDETIINYSGFLYRLVKRVNIRFSFVWCGMIIGIWFGLV
jgi:hypothetical protein